MSLVLSYHVGRDFINILVLVFNGDPGQSWQIDDGQVGTVRGVYIQDDGFIDDVLVFSAYLFREYLYAFFYVFKICELFVGDFRKYPIWFLQVLLVHHSDFQGSPGDYALA